MEAKGVFDLITHIFLLFPIAIILKFTKPKFTKPKEINKDSILLIITCFLSVASILHHVSPDTIPLEVLDEIFVGLSIIYVFYVYVDNIDIHKCNWIILISLGFLAYVICVIIDVIDEINNNANRFATIFCTAVLTLIAIIIFLLNVCCNREDINEKDKRNLCCNWKGISEKYEYLGISVFFAILASVMFIINDVAEQFHLHSLWHLFAFISFGYLVLFAVSPRFKEEPTKTKIRETIMAMNYVLSLSVRLLLIGYYGYVAYLSEIPVGWSIFAYIWGVFTFACGIIFSCAIIFGCKMIFCMNFHNSDHWLGIRLILHGLFWILVGVFLNVKFSGLVIVFLVLDFIISIVFNRKKIMGYWDTLKQPSSSYVYYVEPITPIKYTPMRSGNNRYPALKF